MKNVWLLLVVCLLGLGGCKESNEDKAKKLITQFMKKNADDPNSYESVEVKVDTLFSNVWDDPKYQELFYKQFSFDNSVNDESKYMDSMKNVVLEYEKNFKDKPLNHMVFHRYRSNNSFGAKVMNSSVFYINMSLTKIDSVKHF